MSNSNESRHEPMPDGIIEQRVPLSQAEQDAHVRATRRFDLRRIIGALFVLYGAIVLIVGLADPTGDKAKTGGIAINIWTGIGMLIVGGLFFLWDHLRPVPAEDILASYAEEEEDRAAGEGRAEG
ncbi:hypothetical protein [Luteimicrobium subarcticum]|uniref:Uncharacterized protein n=1 Tax=Luteimicrobium subarcticum TaxID=620910 RepID=A0A2M8WQZ9_9MICO|nr:hypothetical protein [Luteimicrobium subarcticum]PJI93358.1 hypothetical protein CLV34_1927 [Luteimicrobium subarcticum]